MAAAAAVTKKIITNKHVARKKKNDEVEEVGRRKGRGKKEVKLGYIKD